ncbi:oligosaccharide flippase family protein, partial [Arachidicoccus sp.]|uniref:oligosaccharide flippase family protein n=1 Tax=Arachidicoccus sp. TaxID=1872624 RepID=UPI003D1D7D61
MDNLSLKSHVKFGMIWTTIERASVQICQLAINIVLARILMPKDYGLIGMLAIFIGLSQSFVNSGMGSALVQKKNRSNVDFSTVFVFNFFLSILVYLI